MICGPGREKDPVRRRNEKEKGRICRMITAHSGCDSTPENSVEFLEKALGMEVDAVEIDVRKNRDGRLILSHDETEEDAVSLEEAFRMAEEYPEKKVNCDLKEKGLEEEVYRLAAAYGMEDRLIFTGDVNPELFRKGSGRFPGVLWYANFEVFRPEAYRLAGTEEGREEIADQLPEVIRELADFGAAGINWHYSLAEQVLDLAEETGTGISVWTVDDEALQRHFLRRHVDNITSRKAEQLIRLRNEEQQS